MPIQVSTSRLAAQSSGLKCAIYGASGTGKTKLCATAPNPIIISAERGLTTLRNYDVPVIEVTTLAEMWEAYTWLTTSPDAANYHTICLDSASELAEKHLAATKLTAKDPRQAYGELADQMMTVLRAFRDIQGRNVVMLAKEGHYTDAVSGTTKYGPSFPGQQLTQNFAYLFDEVFHIGMQKQMVGDVQEDIRVLRTQADMQYEAKDRSGVLAPLIAVPDMPDGTNSQFLTAIFQQIMAEPNPPAAA